MQHTQTNNGKIAGLTVNVESMNYQPDCIHESHSLYDSNPKPMNFDEQRLQAVVETLAVAQSKGEGLSALAHDARNMVTALGLYCELLEKPGVLAPASLHYANELRLLSAASRRLVEKMVALDSGSEHKSVTKVKNGVSHLSGSVQTSHFNYTPSEPITDLATELRMNRNLLAALAGPSIELHLVTTGGTLPVRLTGEDLTRILVNLVKNAAEAMPDGGAISISLTEEISARQMQKAPETLLLTFTDTGHGIHDDALEAIFVAGFTTRTETDPDSNWGGQHRGLGLSITRSILESNGCTIMSSNLPEGGARFTIKLPVNQTSWVTHIPERSQAAFDGTQLWQKHAKESKAIL